MFYQLITRAFIPFFGKQQAFLLLLRLQRPGKSAAARNMQNKEQKHVAEHLEQF